MFVTVTLFNTNLDEENPYINLGGQEERIAAIKAKFGSGSTLPKSAYNPQHPFRLAINYLAVRGIFNYCVFDFGESFSQGFQRYRFYYIRDALYINDNVSELIVAEDFWARIPPLGINCLPETFTYKNEEISKRFYKNVNASEVYKCVNTYAGNMPFFQLPNSTDLYACFFLVVTCLSSLTERTSSYNYKESGAEYPFMNIALPVVYNTTQKQVEFWDNFWYSNGTAEIKICNLKDFYKLSKVTASGFSIVGSCFASFIPENEYEADIINGEKKLTIQNDYFFAEASLLHEKEGYAALENAVLLIKGDYYDGDLYDIPYSTDLQSFFDEYAKMGYKKITFSCGVNSIDIDPLTFANFNEYGEYIVDNTPFVFKQSFVPPYNVYFGKRAGRTQGETGNAILQTFKNGYLSKKMYIISNSLTAGTYTDTYTEFLRTNYNSAITGLSVQQDAARRELAIKQDAQSNIYTAEIVKKTFKTVSTGALVGAFGGGAIGAAASSLGGITDIVAGAAQLAYQQEAERETLSNNQDKERALLGLKLADIYNAPDSATFYGAIGDCVENALFPRVLFFENVALNEIKFAHKIYGYTMPKRIDSIRQLQAHTRFDYIRANDIIIRGNYPDSMQVLQEVDRLLIEDAFSKGIRFWWTLDGYKDFTLDNPEQ